MTYLEHIVEHCPHCAGKHRFAVEIEKPVELLFAGPPKTVDVTFTCPAERFVFVDAVPEPANGHVIGPADTAKLDSPSSNDLPPPSDSPDDQYRDWIAKSRDTAIEYCKTMLGTSTGAIPVYFAVMKYLGIEKIDPTLTAHVGAVPPVIFLAASIFFVVALQPRLVAATPDRFAEIRAARLRRLNVSLTTGTILFFAGVLMTIVVASLTSWKP